MDRERLKKQLDFIVEIDAGDTFCYGDTGEEARRERETKAAGRLFAIFPPDQGEALWEYAEALIADAVKKGYLSGP